MDREEPVELLRQSAVGHLSGRASQEMLLDGVTVLRVSGESMRMPSTTMPYVLVVLGGRLTLHQRDGVRQFDEGDYLVAEIDVPAMGYIADAPMSALLVEFSLDEITAVLLEFDDGLPASVFVRDSDAPRIAEKADARLLNGLRRLMELADDPNEATFMVKNMKRELIYRLVTGPRGADIVRAVTSLQGAAEMYYVNSWIKNNFRTAFTVKELALRSEMSPSAFHRKFKEAVQMGPLQCQKQLRLTDARRLLLAGAMSVTDVAVHVGYESVSQFSREYRRQFSLPPRQDIAKFQERLRGATQADKAR